MKKEKEINKSCAATGDESAFQCVLDLIVAARGRAERAVNTAVIELYWSVGEYLSLKIDKDGWGKSTVTQLSRNTFNTVSAGSSGLFSAESVADAAVL